MQRGARSANHPPSSSAVYSSCRRVSSSNDSRTVRERNYITRFHKVIYPSAKSRYCRLDGGGGGEEAAQTMDIVCKCTGAQIESAVAVAVTQLVQYGIAVRPVLSLASGTTPRPTLELCSGAGRKVYQRLRPGIKYNFRTVIAFRENTITKLFESSESFVVYAMNFLILKRNYRSITLWTGPVRSDQRKDVSSERGPRSPDPQFSIFWTLAFPRDLSSTAPDARERDRRYVKWTVPGRHYRYRYRLDL
ncbi:hypothetical protein J6590_104979 [Homalodisca vitripennis]|nr:hypothetical protein J6590_104979 [Homalodisca vitripennis]